MKRKRKWNDKNTTKKEKMCWAYILRFTNFTFSFNRYLFSSDLFPLLFSNEPAISRQFYVYLFPPQRDFQLALDFSLFLFEREKLKQFASILTQWINDFGRKMQASYSHIYTLFLCLSIRPSICMYFLRSERVQFSMQLFLSLFALATLFFSLIYLLI